MTDPAKRQVRTHGSTPACEHCRLPLRCSILYGDLRFYVCERCRRWAVPYPPLIMQQPASS